MGIKPALGWLALLLFTTSAQAEGARDLVKPKTPSGTLTKPLPAAVAPVTAKTKAPALVAVAQAQSPGPLSVVESTTKPRTDYEAEVYSGVPLDAPFAIERGLDKGLVTMVFERQRRPAFRIGKDHLRRVVRLGERAGDPRGPAADERAFTLVHASTMTRAKEHVDVLDTDDGIIVVATSSQNAGMFTTSEVYVFPRGAVTLEQRVAALEAAPVETRARIREALVVAEWSR